MEPTLQQIQDLRSKFFQKVDTEGRDLHPRDLLRVTNDDSWLRRFLIHHELELMDALNMLLETCEWRKSKKVHDINEHTVKFEYLSEGSMFIHNRDKDGKSLLIFKCKMHVKGLKDFEELKRCVIYWFERLERLDKGDQMTIFFDMAETGLANMDMEYTKYLINLCKLYYPYFLNYILIFEMPWVLNAAFKVIKSWLPAKAVQKIKFVNRSTLKDYVDKDQALICWGGSDPYEFTFEADSESNRNDENKKKVHFADGSPMMDGIQGGFNDDKIDDFFTSSKLKISPSDAIFFNLDGVEMSGTLNICNPSDSMVTYKIKTTSPEKFRVRPSCGVMTPNSIANINVVLQAGYTPASIVRDKFLIMSFAVDANQQNLELNELWKSCDSKKVDQHRLKCCVAGAGSHNGSPGGPAAQQTFHSPQPSSELDYKTNNLLLGVNQLNSSFENLQSEVRRNHYLNWATLIIVIALALAYAFQSYPKNPTCPPSSHDDFLN